MTYIENVPMELEVRVVKSLMPSFYELVEPGMEDYWDSYDQALSEILKLRREAKYENSAFIKLLNVVLSMYSSNTAKHHAFTDFCLCMEENDVEYIGKFKY